MLKGRKQGLLRAFPGSVVAAGTVTLASNFFLSFICLLVGFPRQGVALCFSRA